MEDNTLYSERERKGQEPPGEGLKRSQVGKRPPPGIPTALGRQIYEDPEQRDK